MKHLVASAFWSFLLLSAVSLHAQVLLEDTFSGSGNLNGQTPTINNTGGSVTWNVQSGGSNTEGGGVDNFSGMTVGTFNTLAYSASNFIDGDTYTLMANFTLTNSNSGWFAIGFTAGTGGGGNFLGDPPGNTAAFMLNNGTGLGVQWFVNNLSSPGTNNTAGLNSGVMEVQLAISDTGTGSLTYFIGANADSLTALNAGSPLTLTAAEVSAITGVGFTGQAGSGSGRTGTLDLFELSVPEPGAYGMVAVGLGALVFVGRLRRVACRT